MVVNAPTSNIVTAAEHAIALLLAAARHIPAADASLRTGQWKRSSVHRRRAQRQDRRRRRASARSASSSRSGWPPSASGSIAYDPYVAPARAAQLGIELVSLDELLRRADMISIHLPKTPETLGLIGKDQLALTKPGVLIVNAARGGLVDEDALAEAVRRGHVGGAGIDVYVTEPTTVEPAVRAAAGGRHPAPRRVDRRGPGPRRARTSPAPCSSRSRASSCRTR